jgi:hypothetical protein
VRGVGEPRLAFYRVEEEGEGAAEAVGRALAVGRHECSVTVEFGRYGWETMRGDAVSAHACN